VCRVIVINSDIAIQIKIALGQYYAADYDLILDIKVGTNQLCLCGLWLNKAKEHYFALGQWRNWYPPHPSWVIFLPRGTPARLYPTSTPSDSIIIVIHHGVTDLQYMCKVAYLRSQPSVQPGANRTPLPIRGLTQVNHIEDEVLMHRWTGIRKERKKHSHQWQNRYEGDPEIQAVRDMEYSINWIKSRSQLKIWSQRTCICSVTGKKEFQRTPFWPARRGHALSTQDFKGGSMHQYLIQDGYLAPTLIISYGIIKCLLEDKNDERISSVLLLYDSSAYMYVNILYEVNLRGKAELN